ncbi:DUF1090 domain-containing protein [Roseateles cavernae]|uniref:DUF1090 domain-containing protein n=1 Tax=Roseateles cavernae TaxID=3153578 RepID=UPI0032E4292F
MTSAAPAFAADRSPACEAKRAAIETQITQAQARGRSQEVAGLNRALAANKARCTDASLAKERETRIRAAERKVAEREKSLREAEHKGDAKKIASRKTKLDEARHELTEAEKPVGS